MTAVLPCLDQPVMTEIRIDVLLQFYALQNYFIHIKTKLILKALCMKSYLKGSKEFSSSGTVNSDTMGTLYSFTHDFLISALNEMVITSNYNLCFVQK